MAQFLLFHQNLYDMSEILKDISIQLSTGKMTPEAQKTAGEITQRMSRILQDLAGLGHGIHYKHQTNIKIEIFKKLLHVK
jgi:hypothetical protein